MRDKALCWCVAVEAWPAFAFRHWWSYEHVDTICLVVAFLFWEGAASWGLGA